MKIQKKIHLNRKNCFIRKIDYSLTQKCALVSRFSFNFILNSHHYSHIYRKSMWTVCNVMMVISSFSWFILNKNQAQNKENFIQAIELFVFRSYIVHILYVFFSLYFVFLSIISKVSTVDLIRCPWILDNIIPS